MRTLMALALLASFSIASAEVMSVRIWKPAPGMQPESIARAMQAKKMYSDLGVQASVGADLMGRTHYVMVAKNWSAMSKAVRKTQANDAWQAFIRAGQKNPQAELEEMFMLNAVVMGDPGKMSHVTVWEPLPGRLDSLIEGGVGAKALHEKQGASVSVLVDQNFRMHYVMAFESWDDWAKFMDKGQSDEMREYMASRSETPSGSVIKTYHVSDID